MSSNLKLTKQDFYNLLLTQGNRVIQNKAEYLFNNNHVALINIKENGDTVKLQVKSQASNRKYDVLLTKGSNGLLNLCTCPYNGVGICKHITAALMFLINSKNGDSPEKTRQYQLFNLYDAYSGYFKFQFIKEEYLTQLNQLYGNLVDFALNEKLTNIIEASNKNIRATFVDKAVRYELHFFIFQKKIGANCNCSSNKKKPCLHKVVLLNLIFQRYGERGLLELFDKEKVYNQLLKPYGFTYEDYPESIFSFDWKGDKVVLKTSVTNLLNKTHVNDISKNLNTVDNQNQLAAIINVSDEIEEIDFKIGHEWHWLNHCAVSLKAFIGKTTKDGSRFKSNFNYKLEALMPGIDNNETIAIQDLVNKLDNITADFGFEHVFREVEKTNKVWLEYLNHAYPIVQQLFKKLSNAYTGYFNDDDYPTSFKNYNPLSISHKNVDLLIEVHQKEGFYHITAKPLINENFYTFKELNTSLSPFFVIKDGVAYLHKNSAAISIFNTFNGNDDFHLIKKDFLTYYKNVLALAEKYFTVNLNFTFDANEVNEIATPQIYLKELNNFLLLQPFVSYKKFQVPLFSKEAILYEDENGSLQNLERDELTELQFKNNLFDLHPKFEEQTNHGFFYLTLNELLKNGWFFDAFEKLKDLNIEVFGQKELKKFKYNPNKPSINFGVSSGIDWFEVKMDVAFGDQKVSLKDIRKALINQQQYVKLSDGTIGVLPENWIEKYATILKMGEVVKNGNLQLSKLHFSILDQLFDDIDELEVQKEIHEKKKKLLNFSEIKKVKLPKQIKATLRPYQKKGYQWLQFIDEFSWGGILADDMGLGKTLQILTLLTAKLQENEHLKVLAVLPTTLIFNWENEIQKFCPHITYHIHRGSNRAYGAENLPEANIYLTSYGLMVNDVTWLKDVNFDYLILDESQAIKNPASKRYKAARLLNAKNRIALTGTPIENNTVDLYAQFNFVNPGFLGSLNFFKQEFATPIDKNGSEEKSILLKKLIYPFLLRRTKEAVAEDLPPKVEDIIYCEMEASQRSVYDAFRNNFREQILNNIDENGIDRSKLQVLAALTQLRLVCNSPAILNTEENYGNGSIKLKLLMEHISEKTSNHKILVFSQFVKMLGLIRNELDNTSISYEYLDGQTSQENRKAAVDHFQKDEKCRVFLISLKAGGTGINLTAADYVYIVDPWWNPAVENQAIDRTHRIGQNKNVFAYRMICKNTIEEKILLLQEKKKSISKDIISSESGFMKKLTKEDIAALFE